MLHPYGCIQPGGATALARPNTITGVRQRIIYHIKMHKGLRAYVTRKAAGIRKLVWARRFIRKAVSVLGLKYDLTSIRILAVSVSIFREWRYLMQMIDQAAVMRSERFLKYHYGDRGSAS